MAKYLQSQNIFEKDYVPIQDASLWASEYLKRNVTASNLSYLIQYGRINKYGSNGSVLIKILELKDYYDSTILQNSVTEKYDADINWHLSFVEYPESERTKHVHRLHPYKGKFIPQLVQYFLDNHTDEFKNTPSFSNGDIVLDPFCGSGTTLVEANTLGLHAIGVDISAFNSMITNVKIKKHNLDLLRIAVGSITSALDSFQKNKVFLGFDKELLFELSKFNNKHFPSPEYKKKIRKGEIDENLYSKEKERIFLDIYYSLVKKYQINIRQNQNDTFLGKWLLQPVRDEANFLLTELAKIENEEIRELLSIIISRTIRSCRATTHADLGTLKDPVTTTYYCKKHGKICKPLFNLTNWWKTYSIDTIKRIRDFDRIRTDTLQVCLTGDSRSIDIYNEIKKTNPDFYAFLCNQKIKGIFSSPPYVGLIDYHEQHAYAYELFNQDRNDKLEIGPLSKGQGKDARDSYVQGIVQVLLNSKKFLQEDYDIFLVANDKYGLYPAIANSAQMKIVNQFKRPVLNRVEKVRNSAFSETIFHMKEK